MTLKDVADSLLEKFVSGALKNGGSWGGPECRAYIGFQTHIIESMAWLLIWICPFLFSKMQLSVKDLLSRIRGQLEKEKPVARILEISLSLVHFGIFGATIYYKWRISSLINLIQPCHLILLFEGVALYSRSQTSVLITLFILPILSGTLLAIFFPDVSGLDQFLEVELYWIQHYLIIVVPFILLTRWNFFALQFANAFTIFVGLCILGVLHFFFYESIDLLLNVNVEFMLCPTSAMATIFSAFPPWVTYPTYRTVLTFVVISLGYLLSYLYIGAAWLLRLIVGRKKTAYKSF